ncbi:hypothetical protein GCM10010401_11660 [Rarobacter faecitabidus]|uniref:Ig-like domain-containing protein n=1 Tax=Rarobacter faecitabidus TaxID=13243 RepID=A0A542ZPA6_RARFA|nr:Ig-like domain repeat protein [Rarobacter faecitabidus]TQL62096.1 Ig-like domain-containing protein [Rarobacter faecitabidus]
MPTQGTVPTGGPLPRRSPRRMRTSLLAAVASAALIATMGVTAPLAATAAPTPTPAAAPSVADLGMTGAGQQRWQSLAKSRIVLNPFDRYAKGDTNLTMADPETSQSWGPELPLRAAYYANDEALRFPDLLTTYRKAAAGTAPAPVSTVLPGPYTPANGWQEDRAAATATGSSTLATVTAGNTFGKIYKTVSVNLNETPNLTLTVDALDAGSAWAFEVNSIKLMPNDSTISGTFTYDLATLTGLSGQQNLELRIWVSGGAGKSVTFSNVTLHGDVANPAQDKKVLARDDMSSASGWTSASQEASFTSNGDQGIVKIVTGSLTSTYGAVKKSFGSINVTATTKLAIKVDVVTNKWYLNALVDGSGTQKTLSAVGSNTGWIVVDNFATQVGTGTHSLELRLATDGGRPSAVAFDDLIIFDSAVSETWAGSNLEGAQSFDTSWTASQETFTGNYGANGTITGRDVFASTDAVVREVDTTSVSGDVVVGGKLQGTPAWNASTKQLTVTGTGFVQVYQLPDSATVGFGSAVSNATGSTATGATAWSATLPNGGVHKIAIAFKPVSTSATYAPGMTAAAAASSASTEAASAYAQNVSARVGELDAYWADYLAKVPVPQDFSLHSVPAYGASALDIEKTYYRAWINLEQNVIPATPETNSLKAQLGTGKASMWMSGIPGAKNVATWDTLVGLQTLVYADPSLAWESFTGIMDFVQPSGSAFPGEITNDPTKGGEVLPSRKAQTAWILYNATGDASKLNDIYPALKRVLDFGATNLHWTVKDRGVYNYTQRDSEFVTSLIIDLGYAKKIAAKVGATADIAHWDSIEQHLYSKFDSWFVRTDGVFQQKVTLASNDDNAAVTTGTGANGDNSVVVGSLVLPGLSARAKTAILGRFAAFNADKQWAGFGDNLKGPNINYITAGLLDNEHVTDGKVKATQFSESVIRDVTRSGWFAEVYKKNGNEQSDKPLVDGVRPSLFGIAAFIDSVWINNGFRLSLGDPSFVRLSAGHVGGISGLTAGGNPLNVDLTSQGIVLTGAAVNTTPAQCEVLAGAAGQTIQLPGACVGSGVVPAPLAAQVGLTVSPESTAVADASPAVATIDVSQADQPSRKAIGTVTLVDADTNATYGSATLANGTATVNLPTGLGVGIHRLRATFAPANAQTWAPGTSQIVTYRITGQATSTTLTLSQASQALGEAPASAQVTVTGTGGTPTGTVQLVNAANSSVLATGTLVNGSVVVTLPNTLAAGTYQLQARYVPTAGSTWEGSSSANQTLTVTDKASATLQLGLGSTSIVAGGQPQASVSITTTGQWTAGVVTIHQGSRQVARVTVGASKTAQIKLPRQLTAGKVTLQARFAGSSTVAAATSPNATLTVTKAAAKVKVKAKKTVKKGKRLTITVTVSGPAGLAKAGKATVKLGKAKAKTVKVNAKGVAKVKIKAAKRGKQKIAVAYKGSAALRAKSATASVKVK